MRRGTYEQYQQELLQLGKVEPVFTLTGNTYYVHVPGIALGSIRRSVEGFWRYFPEHHAMYDDIMLAKIARELRRLNDADKGTTSRIHQ